MSAQIPPTAARMSQEENAEEESAEEEICSYEEQRDKIVARLRKLMLPLVQASKSL